MAKLTHNPSNPAGPPDGSVTFGYTPPSPVLQGHSIKLVVAKNGTTQTDSPLPIVFNGSKSVATGTAAQNTYFAFTADSAWSGGGGEATAQLLDASGNVVDTDTFTVG